MNDFLFRELIHTFKVIHQLGFQTHIFISFTVDRQRDWYEQDDASHQRFVTKIDAHLEKQVTRVSKDTADGKKSPVLLGLLLVCSYEYLSFDQKFYS